MNLNKENLRILRADLDAALAEVAKKHGIEMEAGSCRFNPMDRTATFKLDCVFPDPKTGEIVDPETQDLRSHPMHSKYEGLIITDHELTQYKVTGYKKRSRKRPFVAELVSDPSKRYVFPLTSVQIAYAKQNGAGIADAVKRNRQNEDA